MNEDILKIYRFGEEVLQQAAPEIQTIDDPLIQLVAKMKETMYQAPGVGLAAPQIGRSIRLAVIDPSLGAEPEHFMILINPEILEADGAETDDEGCLSIPGFTFPIRRYSRLLLKFTDLQGHEYKKEFSGFPARVIQHEIDHLLGKLILDHLSTLKRKLVKQEIKKLVKSGQW